MYGVGVRAIFSNPSRVNSLLEELQLEDQSLNCTETRITINAALLFCFLDVGCNLNDFFKSAGFQELVTEKINSLQVDINELLRRTATNTSTTSRFVGAPDLPLTSITAFTELLDWIQLKENQDDFVS